MICENVRGCRGVEEDYLEFTSSLLNVSQNRVRHKVDLGNIREQIALTRIEFAQMLVEAA